MQAHRLKKKPLINLMTCTQESKQEKTPTFTLTYICVYNCFLSPSFGYDFTPAKLSTFVHSIKHRGLKASVQLLLFIQKGVPTLDVYSCKDSAVLEIAS